MNFRELVKSELQMEAHSKPAVYVKSWGGAQNEKSKFMTYYKHTRTMLCAAI